MGSLLPSRDQTHVPCIGRQSLTQWTTEEVPKTLLIHFSEPGMIAQAYYSTCVYIHLTAICNDSLLGVCIYGTGKAKLRETLSLLWLVAAVIKVHVQTVTAVMGVVYFAIFFTCILWGSGESGWGRDCIPFCSFYRYGVSLPACPLSCPPPTKTQVYRLC